MNRLANILVLALLAASGNAKEIPTNLVQTLKYQAKELSPIAFKWTDNGLEQQVFWQHGCVYCGCETDATTFDGTTIFWQFENSGQRVLLETYAARIEPARENVRWIRCGYLDAAGWELPSTASELVHCDCQSVILKLLGSGASVERIAGAQQNERNLLLVELAGPGAIRYAFYVDPGLGDAIRRQETFVNGQPAARVDNDDFQRLGGGDLWLPRRALVEASGKTHEMHIASISQGPMPSNQFTLKADQLGELISDETVTGGQLNFQIPAPPETLDSDELIGLAQPERSESSNIGWILFASASLSLLIAGWTFRFIMTHRRP